MKYTIIITVYNKEKYIERCIKSACKQNFDDYQIMIVNDGSTDNSEKLIKKYLKNKKIKYYKKENSGIADTRNYAIEKVETEYFLFLDADDYISIDLLETIDKYKDYEVLSFNAVNIDNRNKFIKKMNKPHYTGDGKEFFKKIIEEKSEFTVPWGYVYNTNYFRKNNFEYPQGKILEDFYLTPFIILEAKKVISIDYCGYYYVTNDNSIMTSKTSLISETYFEHYEKMAKRIKKYDVETQKVFNSFLAGALIWYGSVLKGKERKKYIKQIKNKRIINQLDRTKIKKDIIKIFYNMNIYYPVRKILKGGK